VRRVVFLYHLDAGAAVLGDLVDIGALHQTQAYVCMPFAAAVRGRSEGFPRPGCFKKFALPLGKIRSVGFGRTPLFARNSRCFGCSCGRVRASTRAGRSRLLSRLKGNTGRRFWRTTGDRRYKRIVRSCCEFNAMSFVISLR